MLCSAFWSESWLNWKACSNSLLMPTDNCITSTGPIKHPTLWLFARPAHPVSPPLQSLRRSFQIPRQPLLNLSSLLSIPHALPLPFYPTNPSSISNPSSASLVILIVTAPQIFSPSPKRLNNHDQPHGACRKQQQKNKHLGFFNSCIVSASSDVSVTTFLEQLCSNGFLREVELRLYRSGWG